MERIHLTYKLVSFDLLHHAAFIRAVDRSTGEILDERIESIMGVTAADALPDSVLQAVSEAKARFPEYDVVHPLKVVREA